MQHLIEEVSATQICGKQKWRKWNKTKLAHAPKHCAGTRNWHGMVASSYRRGVSNPNLHAENNLCSLLARGNGNNTCRNSKTRRETCGSNMHVLPFLGRWDFCFWMTYTKNCPKSAGNNMCSVLVWGNGNNTCRNSKTRRETCMWFQHACFTVPRAVGVLLLASFLTCKQQELS